jgi:hypothetical protein
MAEFKLEEYLKRRIGKLRSEEQKSDCEIVEQLSVISGARKLVIRLLEAEKQSATVGNL